MPATLACLMSTCRTADDAVSGEGTEWHLHLDEHMPRRCMRRTSMPQVPGQHLGHRGKQRQQEIDAGLRAQHLQRTDAPVDILHLQADHFTCAQAVGAHHQQQRVVAQSARRARVHSTQKSLNVLPRQGPLRPFKLWLHR